METVMIKPLIGIYFLKWNNHIVYVGQSKDILNRVKTHRIESCKRFDDFGYIECKESELNDLESQYIKDLQPVYNIASNPKVTKEKNKNILKGSPNKSMVKILTEKGMSMYQLANEINESQQRTHYIVKKKNFTEDYLLLKNIAKALDCEIEDLLENSK